ncbi:protein YchT [Escherichia coli]|nr:protein YchT [Escherichia coli]
MLSKGVLSERLFNLIYG